MWTSCHSPHIHANLTYMRNVRSSSHGTVGRYNEIVATVSFRNSYTSLNSFQTMDQLQKNEDTIIHFEKLLEVPKI